MENGPGQMVPGRAASTQSGLDALQSPQYPGGRGLKFLGRMAHWRHSAERQIDGQHTVLDGRDGPWRMWMIWRAAAGAGVVLLQVATCGTCPVIWNAGGRGGG